MGSLALTVEAGFDYFLAITSRLMGNPPARESPLTEITLSGAWQVRERLEILLCTVPGTIGPRRPVSPAISAWEYSAVGGWNDCR